MSKATAAWTEPTTIQHRPALRVLPSPHRVDETRSHALSPAAILLGLGLWAVILTFAWGVV